MSAPDLTPRAPVTVDLARTDPARLYDAAYYRSGCSLEGYDAYGRHEPWLSFFGNAADRIVRRYQPRTAIDIGCAFGLLVEALCDRGVDAYGVDVSPYAVSNARDDMADRLWVQSVVDPIPVFSGAERYDLAICIEVLEHLPPEQAEAAIANICSISDRVLFSSSPDDFDEPTHFNVLPASDWLTLFAACGFVPAWRSSARYVSPHAFVVERRSVSRRGVLGRLLG